MSDDTFYVGIPRCITCGYPIGGAIQKIFNEMRLERINTELAKSGEPITPTKENNLLIDPNLNIHTNDILDSLHIYNPCCRGQLVTWQKFRN